MTNLTDSQNNLALTSPQKRLERENVFLNPQGLNFISSEAEQLYRVRARRMIDVYAVRQPDRVPVAFHFGSLPLKLYGLDYYTGMSDYQKASEAYNSFNSKYAADLETFANPAMIQPWNVLDTLEYALYAWPGHGLPKTAAGFQFVEGEYMKAHEYADLIENPSDFWMRIYLPRIFGAFSNFGSLDSLTDIIEIPTGQLMPLASPQMQGLLKKLLAVGEELGKRNQFIKDFGKRSLEAGYPSPISYFTKAPFDVLGDTLRGTQGIMKDMYRNPDQLVAALDIIANLQIKSVLKKANQSKGLIVGFPLHKGADGWMSQKQFDKFYWPSLKKVIDAFVNEGLMVSLFAEGSYNSRLDSINEFPKGAVHWWFDRTDMLKAKKVLGDKCSIAGNVPSSMLLTGTPRDVTAFCNELIDKCGSGGGFVLSEGAADVDSKIENLKGMVASARTRGVY